MAINYKRKNIFDNDEITVIEDENGKKVENTKITTLNYKKKSIFDDEVAVIEDENGKKVKNTKGTTLDSLVGLNRINQNTIKHTSGGKTSKQEEENNNTFFKKGAFDDGYQFGDVTKTVASTVGDAVVGVGKGIFRLGEGIGDAISYGIADIQELTGNKNAAEKTRERTKESITDDIFKPAADFVDKNSVLGNKSDSVAEGLGYVAGITAISVISAGAGSSVGLSAGTAATIGSTAATFTSSYGHGVTEALNDGATMDEARIYGAISGAAEAGSELMFGGLGKASEAIGLSKGALDDVITSGLTKKIKNRMVKTIVQSGIKAGGEGLEEVVSGLISSVGKKVTYMKDKELKQIIKDENLMEQFWMGALTSAIAEGPSTLRSIRKGTDYITGRTNNEQKVYDNEVNERANSKIKEQTIEQAYNEQIKTQENLGVEITEDLKQQIMQKIEKAYDNGTLKPTELNKKDILKIQDEVESDMQEGNISSESIMKILGENQDLSKDNLLLKSIYESEQKYNSYQVEQTDNEKVNVLMQSAADAGMNNTKKARKKVELISKLVKDTDRQYKFVSPEQLKQMGYNENANGLIDKASGEILINVHTDKGIQSIIGHETTHIFDSKNSKGKYSKEYQALQEAAIEYAKTKGIYDSKIKSIIEAYGDLLVDETQVREELTADLVGDFLFNDEKFIENLAVKDRNIFQKLYDYIKRTYKMMKGTDEEKAFENLKHQFEKVYKTISTETDTDTKYSVGGKEGMNNAIKNNTGYLKLERDYNRAQQMQKNGIDNENIRQLTGWFQDKNGDWKFEFSDKYMSLKKNIKLEANKTYKLGNILEHDILFTMYPELANYKVKFEDINAGGVFKKNDKTIKINNNKLILKNSKIAIEGTMIHEIQHAIQNIESFENGKSSKGSKLAYYNKLGEIEADDTKQRFLKEKNGNLDRNNIAPESSKANPKHSKLNKYLENRSIIDKMKDSLYNYINDRISRGENNEEVFEEDYQNVEDEDIQDQDQGIGLVVGGRSIDSSKQYNFIDEGEIANETKNSKENVEQIDEKSSENLLQNGQLDDRKIWHGLGNRRGRFLNEIDIENVNVESENNSGSFSFDQNSKRHEDLQSANEIKFNKRTDDTINIEIMNNEELINQIVVISKEDASKQLGNNIANYIYNNATENTNSLKLKQSQDTEMIDTSHKGKQLDIIKKTNPMLDDYHVGIRTVEDIKTFDEVINDEESFAWGDFSKNDAKKALKTGKITIYSSNPIKNGVFVSTSYIQAEQYAGGKDSKVYSKRVPIEEVAWINGDEGQYANVNQKYLMTNIDSSVKYSIQENSDGNKYVKVDTDQDIFTGKNIKEQTKIAQEYILNNFRKKGLLKDENAINITRKTANEYTHPKNGLDNKTYSSKMKASTELNNLLEISKYIKSEADDGRHIFAENGWDYYETVFRVGNKTYSGWLNIANGKNGRLLYDITNIKERASNYSVKTVSVANSNLNNSIAPLKKDVNNTTKYSMTNDTEITGDDIAVKDLLKQEKNTLNEEVGSYIDNNYKKTLDMSDLQEYLDERHIDYTVDEDGNIIDIEDESVIQDYLNDKDTIKEDNTKNKKSAYKELQQKYKQMEIGKREYEKLLRREKPTEVEKITVDRLLKGEIEDNEIPASANRQRVVDLYNAKAKFYNVEQEIKKQRKEFANSYRNLAKDMTQNIFKWKDKKRGIQYQVNTMKRNLRDIIPNKTEADAVYNEYFRPITKNNAIIEKEINKYNERISKFNINNTESQYIQMIGENKYNPDSELPLETIEEFYDNNKSKIDVSKCQEAVKEFRNIYNELIVKINDTLVENGYKPIEYREGYFPHFIEDKAETILGKFAEKLGWKVNKDTLPTDIAGITDQFKPGKSWTSFSQQRRGDSTDYNALKGYDNYIRGAMDVIYHTKDIQKLRALENEIRYQYSEKGIKEKIDSIYNDNEISIEEKQQQIDETFENIKNNPMGNFATELRSYTDNLANKKSRGDRSMEQSWGRQTYSVMTNIQNRVSANMVGANISSALTNFIPITQAWSQTSTKNTMKAIRESVAIQFKDDGFSENSTFLTNRTEQADRLYKTGLDKVNDKLGYMFDVVDSFTSNVIVRAKYYDNIDAGMSINEAIDNADEFAKDVMAGRSKGDMPTLFNKKNPVAKLFTAFQLEVNNQYGYMLKDLPVDLSGEAKEKLVGAFVKMFLGAYLYNILSEKITGRKSAFSPIDIAIDSYKTATNDELSSGEKIVSIGEDMVGELPFISGIAGGGRLSIQGAIPYDDPVSMVSDTITNLSNVFDGDTNSKQTAIKSLLKEWSRPLYYVALPFAGGQLKKSAGGVSMYLNDVPGSYANNGDLRFTVDDDIGSKIKATIFGTYANPYAQDYIDSGYKSISKKNIDEMVGLDMNSTEYREYKKGLNQYGKTEEKLNYINSLDLTDSQKTLAANNLNKNSKKQIDMSEYGDYSSYDEYKYARDYPEKYSVIKQIDSYDNYEKYKDDIADIKEQYSTDNGYKSDERKSKVQSYINSLDLDMYQKMMLEKIAGGYSIKDYAGYIQEYLDTTNLTQSEKYTIWEELFN